MSTAWLTIDPERDTRTPAEIRAEIEQAFLEAYRQTRIADIMRLDGWIRSGK